MNRSFQWSFSYLNFTKCVTNIIDEPKYKYGQQEQVTVRNHNRSTALERSVLKYWGAKTTILVMMGTRQAIVAQPGYLFVNAAGISVRNLYMSVTVD